MLPLCSAASSAAENNVANSVSQKSKVQSLNSKVRLIFSLNFTPEILFTLILSGFQALDFRLWTFELDFGTLCAIRGNG